MKHLFPLFAVGLLAGCTSIIKTGDKVERGLTPPDALNYATTKPEGGFTTQINDMRFGNKLELLAARKSKTPGGYVQVQWDLRNGSLLPQSANVGFEWLNAAGSVTEPVRSWTPKQFEPGELTTLTATALRADSAECRLRLLSR